MELGGFEYREGITEDGKPGFIMPITFQFLSEKTNGKYHRIGDETKIMNDAIYRVKSYDDLGLLTKGEITELFKQHNLLARLMINDKNALEDIIEYCKNKK